MIHFNLLDDTHSIRTTDTSQLMLDVHVLPWIGGFRFTLYLHDWTLLIKTTTDKCVETFRRCLILANSASSVIDRMTMSLDGHPILPLHQCHKAVD